MQTCEANRELTAFYINRKFIIRCSKKYIYILNCLNANFFPPDGEYSAKITVL